MQKTVYKGGNNHIKILSPVHIGSGEVYSPLNFYCEINDDQPAFTLFYHINSEKLISKLFEEKKIDYPLLESGNFRKIRQIFHGYLKKNRNFLNKITLYSYYADIEVYKKYQELLNNPRNESKLEIQRLQYGVVKKKHIIPGSSIKGSIRTAILSFLGNENIRGKNHFKGRDFETAITGGIRNDPFNNLIVGDIEIDPEFSTIFEGKEIKKNPENENKTPKGFFEAIFDYGENGHKCSILIQNQLEFRNFKYKIISVDEIKKITADFYYNRFEEEYKKFYKKNRADFDSSEVDIIKQELYNAKKDGKGILRIGHFSHAECMSVDGFRNIKGKRIGSNSNVYGTSRTLADGFYPFGWIIWN